MDYPNLSSQSLNDFYRDLFMGMEAIIKNHHSHGNWAIGMPALTPRGGQRELGIWYAESIIAGFDIPGAISLAVVPGEARLGLFLPLQAMHHEADTFYLEDQIATSYDGRQPDYIRRQQDRVLFDRILRDPPFDVRTMAAAMRSPQAPEHLLLMQRLAYSVVTLWMAAIRVIYEYGRTGADSYVVQTIGAPMVPEDMQDLPNGVMSQSNDMGNDQFVSYVRTSATQEHVHRHLSARGVPIQSISKVQNSW